MDILLSPHTRYSPDQNYPPIDRKHLQNRTHASVVAGFFQPDAVTRLIIVAHAIITTAAAAIYAVQLLRKKGGAQHRWMGSVGVWVTACVILTGAALWIKRDFIDEWHTEGVTTLPSPWGWAPLHGYHFVGSFLASFTMQALHAFDVPFTKRVSGALLWGLHAVSLWMYVRTGQYYYWALQSPHQTAFDEAYHWERFVFFLYFPIVDLLNIAVVWVRGARLNRLAHHEANSIWCASSMLATWLFLLAHDARHVIPYPGMGFTPRMLVQIVPQLYYFNGHRHRLYRHYVEDKKSD